MRWLAIAKSGSIGGMKAKGRDKPQQIAALPYRIGAEGRTEVLLVTSRETGRWIVPKGWPMKHRKRHEAAAQEAFEEAGVRGEIAAQAIGRYVYWKRKADHFVLCRVEVFPLRVREQLATWREKGQRETRWFTPEEAALHILEPDLADLVRRLPAHLRKPG
jgi:8-oxo-dGTP pyrophosphatase MutT (NUDIX family)